MTDKLISGTELQRYPVTENSQGYYQPPMVSGPMVGQGASQLNQKAVSETTPGPEATPQSGGFQKFHGLDGIFLKQKLEVLEVVTGFETENRYDVFALDKSGNKKGRRLFKCKEKSSCCARQCLSGPYRPFQMNISTLVNGEDDGYEPFLRLERPWKCTFFCFARPEVLVTLVEGEKEEYLGKIVDPWHCGDNIGFDVYDKDHTKKYSIEGSCCQLGIWCKFPCEACQTIDFNVKSLSGEVLSSLQKRSQGCMKAAVSDSDNFILNFPKNSTLAERALLMSAVLFIDFRHFESKNDKNQHKDHEKNNN